MQNLHTSLLGLVIRLVLLVALVYPAPFWAQNTPVYPGAVPDYEDLLVVTNRAQSTLTAGITGSSTTIPLQSAGTFFNPGANEASVVRIGNEYIKYCSITGNALNVCTSGRGFDGSIATSHGSGALVTGTAIAYEHNQTVAEIIALAQSLGAVTTVAGLPGAPTDGEMARVTDGNSALDCTTGGGAFAVLCIADGGIWGPVAGAAGGAPVGATYITQVADATLTNEQALGALATGILKSTTATGVLSIATEPDFPAALARDSELHSQTHNIEGADHTAAGLAVGEVLRATAATTFAFGPLVTTDLPAAVILNTEIDTEAELEGVVGDVANIFTNNDGALTDDDLSDDAITALSDVAAKTGTGTTVVFSVGPTLTGALDVTGAEIAGASPLVFEGLTPNLFETTFAITDPTADRTVTFPDAGGEVSLLGQTIDLSSEVTGVAAKGSLPASIAYEDEANVFTSTLDIDNNQRLRLFEPDGNGTNYIEFVHGAVNRTTDIQISWANITGPCAGANGGALTLNGAAPNLTIDCEDDDGGGASLTVEEADLTPSVASVTTIQFDQADGFTVTDETGGQVQIDLVNAPDAAVANNITLDNITQITARAITDTTGDLPLGSRTSGNYVLDVTCGQGLTGCVAAAEGATEALALSADGVRLTELNDDANTPAAGNFLIVETGDNSVDYLAANAGTDITADLEEEAHASEHTAGGADIVHVDGTDAGAATTRSNWNQIQVTSHNTDCTSLTDGKRGEICFEEDANTIYVCEPTAGDCSGAEWVLISGGGSEVNDLEATVTSVLDNEVFVGTGADAGTYIALSTAGALAFDGSVFSQAALAGLSDVTAKTGTGTVVVMSSGPTISGVSTFQGNVHLNDGVGDTPAMIFTPATGAIWAFEVLDGTDDFQFRTNTAGVEQVVFVNQGTGQTDLNVDGDMIVGIDLHVPATGWTNATHAHAAANSGGQIDVDNLSGLNDIDTAFTFDGVLVDFDGGTAEATLRLPNSITLPGTCTIGDTYWDTDADTDGSLYVCRATNIWKEVDDDGGAGGGNAWTTIGTATADVAGDTMTITDTLSVDLVTANDPEDLSAALRYDHTLAGNPVLNLGELVFSDDNAGGCLMSEGSVADVNEGRFCFPDTTGADADLDIVTNANPVTSVEGNGLTVSSGTQAVQAADTTISVAAGGISVTEANLDLTNLVALTTDTTGNYVASITNGVGITGGDGGSEGAALTLAFDFSDAGANWAGGSDEARFTNEGVSAGGIVFEGATADGIETKLIVTDPTVSDKTITLPNASGEVTLLGQEIALTTETSGNYVLDVTCGQGLTGCVAAAEGATEALALSADGVRLTELNDDANTPVAGNFLIVEVGANSVDYLAADAGTDITADLEEEAHASEHTAGGADIVTVDGVDAGAATTRTNENKIQIASHDTDCTSLTDGVRGELCIEEDSENLYSCQPTAGGCDTPGEWILTGDGGGGGNSFGIIGAATADSGNDTITVTDSATIDFTTTNDPEDLTAAFLPAGVGTATWLDNADRTWTWDIAAAGVNPTAAFAASSIEFDAHITIDDEQELRLKEEDAGGENYLGFKAPAAVTANGVCTLLDSSTDIIPIACIGDILADEVITLGTETTGNYAAGNAEGGDATSLAGDALDAVTEIAATIKRSGDDVDLFLLTTNSALPAGNVCLEMTSGGSVVTTGDTCANLTTLDSIGDAAAAGTVLGAEWAQSWNWDSGDVTAAALDALTLSYDLDASTTDITTQRVLRIVRANSGNDAAGQVEALVSIENLDTNDTVTAGIEVRAAAGLIGSALDLNDAQITNLITHAGGNLTSAELDQIDEGHYTQGGEVADAGQIRLQNAGVIGWERATPGTDITLTVDSGDDFVFDEDIDMGTGKTLRLDNAVYLTGRNPANTAEIPLIAARGSGSTEVDVGDASTAVVWINGDFMSFAEAGVANTKIRLANSGGVIGIGVQSGQLRLHHNAATSRTSFLDSAAGNEIFSVGGDAGGGVRWYDRGAEPSCVAGQLGRVRFDDAATDTFKICMDNGGGLTWVNLVGTTNHDILSATHNDTTTATAVRGDLMIANATPAWDRVAIGANGSFLKSDGTDPAWSNDIEGGDVGAGTTHPAGSTIVRVLRHNTNCQSITDGKDGEMCWDTDDNRIYVCEPTAGDCSGTEWEQITDNDSGGTPAWEALINSADTATTYDSTAVAETVDFDFQAAYTTGNLFTIRGTTGNPTGGTLLNVQSHDAQLAIANFWDGTNGVQVSAAGAMNAVGSGSIDADTLTMAAGTALTVDNELHFVEEATAGQPTCAVGDFWIWADDTLNKIRGCDDGTLYDLNTAGGAAHNLLGSTHSDTLTAAVSRGSIVVGNVTPAWSELVIGGANTVLGSDGTDATWTTLAKAHLPSAIAYEDEANTFTATQTIGTGGILTTSGTGFIRLPNAAWLVGRNFANTADVNLLRLTASDEIFIGDSGMAVVWIGGDFLSFSEGGFANQKIRLATGSGLGVQSGQTRIHHNGATARTTFLDGVAGNDVFEVGGEAGGGVQWFDRGAEPACVAAELGRVRLDDAATDTFKVCMDDGGGLAWVSLAVDEFDELTGTVGDTQIAVGAVDGGAAGEIADNSVTTEDLEATLQDFTVSIAIESPTTGQSFLYQWETPHQCTMQEIQCNTKGTSTTATINFDERARATPDTAGTTVATSDLVCDNDGQNTTVFSNAAIAANVPVALEIVAVSGTAPDVVRIHARCRRD